MGPKVEDIEHIEIQVNLVSSQNWRNQYEVGDLVGVKNSCLQSGNQLN